MLSGTGHILVLMARISLHLPSVTTTKVGMSPPCSRRQWSFKAPLVRRYLAQGYMDRHRSTIVESIILSGFLNLNLCLGDKDLQRDRTDWKSPWKICQSRVALASESVERAA